MFSRFLSRAPCLVLMVFFWNLQAKATSLRQPAPDALSSSGDFTVSSFASSQTTWQGLLCLANPRPCAHHGAVGQEGFSRQGLQWTQLQLLNDSPWCEAAWVHCLYKAQEWSENPPRPPVPARRRARSVSSESNPCDGGDHRDDDDSFPGHVKAKHSRQ